MIESFKEMKKLLLTTILGLTFATTYAQTKKAPEINLKEVKIHPYGQKKEKPKTEIYAKNIGEHKNYSKNDYFSINMTPELKRKIPGSKLEKKLRVLSAVLFQYEGKYLNHQTFIDGEDKNIELKRIILGKIGENNKDNFEGENKTIKKYFGKTIIFLEYLRDEKIEQVPYIFSKEENAQEIIEELKE